MATIEHSAKAKPNNCPA